MLMRLLIRSVGRTSRGIRIAFEHGFTSGVMLEYIYRNQAQGSFLIGKLIDRAYLSHVGWEVIRTRKRHLEQLLGEAIEMQRKGGRKPTILDVASGPGQYVLDVLSGSGMEDISAVCRDLADEALALGRRNAAERGLDSVTFAKGDALSRESLRSVQPGPNIAVSSGFYDWIVDDDLVRKSMSLVYDLLPDEGCFLFTNQSGHFDLQMVQSVFVDFRGQPLQMVVRPAETVNGWAKAAGFEILQTLSDERGHYSVTLAMKRAGRNSEGGRGANGRPG
jgi:SAM-dependent methyltransferase